MKILIVDDDFMSRNLLHEMLKDYGITHSAVNGKEAVAAVHTAIESGKPYNLICLDILMPELDGQQALRQIRAREEAAGLTSSDTAKIIMITTLGDSKNLFASFKSQCDGYVIKPIDINKLQEELCKLGLIK